MSDGDIQGTEGPGGSLLQQAEAARRAEIAAVVAEIQARMKEYGITVADLGGGAKKAKVRGAVAAGYRNPATGEAWSGSRSCAPMAGG